MYKLNLLKSTAGLRYHQAKQLLHGSKLFREYRRVQRGRNLVVALPGPTGLGRRPQLTRLMQSVGALADRTREIKSVYFKGHTRGMRFRFNMHPRQTYGGLGAFRGQGRGWRRLLKSLKVKQ